MTCPPLACASANVSDQALVAIAALIAVRWNHHSSDPSAGRRKRQRSTLPLALAVSDERVIAS